ncbi:MULTISPECIES: hypothetical protein [unclassified Rhizobium]|uniref:hypothetical protein n=1 Tax=unclassified Rhizobium TaxID=2613769 RepID=UPI0010526CF7|nr:MULTISPECIES: hypothetical protein [unclassified Rhizobium]MBB3394204.1 hypothetical protein [Rhizobium sp. BK060]MBB4169701.1 hypothetical protein [Rhizobium sp. BK538]TCM65161.1 hypothetical protein EV291_14338 [Rhizobium sp. BK068]
MVEPELSEAIEDQFLEFSSTKSGDRATIERLAGFFLGNLLKEKVPVAQQVVQVVIRAADLLYADGFIDSLAQATDAEALPADIGVTCYWNEYHRLSAEAPLPDIAPLYREYHALEKGGVDVTALVTSGLSEPAAISGNLRRVRERTGSTHLLVVTSTATQEEIDILADYLSEDRIYDARLLLGADPSVQHRLRRLLPQIASENVPDNSYTYPSFLDGLHERYGEYRANRMAGFGP